MQEMLKSYMNVDEVMEFLGISKSKAYNIMRELNVELKEKGYVVIPGRINKTYFMEKCCYGGMPNA